MSIPQSNFNPQDFEPADEDNTAEPGASEEIDVAAVSVEFADVNKPGGEGGTPG